MRSRLRRAVAASCAGPRRVLERRRRRAERRAAAAATTAAVDRARHRRPRPRVELTIYGAASLKGALEQGQGRATRPPTRARPLTISTDSSSALETQIEQGAPADVFLSADTTNPQKLVDEGLTDGPAVDFAGNKLTVIVPTANPAGHHDAGGPRQARRQDHRRRRRRADHQVRDPARRQPRQGSRATRPTSPPAYAANIVSKEDNVKAVVAKIELGEGDAGDRLRDRRQGLRRRSRRSTSPTAATSPRPTPASSSRRRRTRRRPGPS